MHQNTHVRTAFLGLFLLAAPAAAQSTGILGRDDGEFARQLYSKGWTDLAQGVGKAMDVLEKDPKTDPMSVLEVRAVGLDIKLDLARRETDPVKRKQSIAEVIAAKEQIVADFPRSPIGRNTRDNLPDAFRQLGEALTEALAKSTDAGEQAKLRSEGESAFERSETDLKQRLEDYREKRVDDPAADVQYMNALFNLGRTQYFHARFYPAGDQHAEILLGMAITTFEDLGLDYGDRLLNFEAIHHIGLSHKLLGKSDDALGDWDYIIDRLREGFDADARGRVQFPEEVADLVSKVTLQKVQLLAELNRTPEAIAAADDFWTKTVEPESASSGFALLAKKAELQVGAGDTTAAGDTAKRLIDLDPQGPWGNKGRELMVKLIGASSGSKLGPAEILRVAQNLMGDGRLDQSMVAARQALNAAKGNAKEQDIGSNAMYLLGQIYRKQGDFYSASLVWDMTFERYPKGEASPDALAGSMDCYLKLNAKEKRPFYKSRAAERGKTLVGTFPNHRAAGSVQLADARALKEEGKFLEAAQSFRSVQPNTPNYPEAQAQAGLCLLREGQNLASEKKVDQAKPLFKEAETVLTKALAEIASAKSKSLDQAVLGALTTSEYVALTSLARLYLQDAVAKPDLALKTLEGTDERFSSDSGAIEGIWQIRISALEKLGRTDEAVSLFDGLLAKQTDRSGLSGAAGILARSLDTRAVEMTKTPAKAQAAKESWRKSVAYYRLSVQPMLDDRTKARASQLEPVAKRLLELGMQFNGVPEEVTSFVAWDAPAKLADSETWESSATIYATVIELDPANYRARIRLGRVLGFLKEWKNAAGVYAAMFEQQALVRPDKQGFDIQVVQNMEGLLDAYLEWGVCEAQTGVAEKDAGRQSRASGIFDLLVLGTTSGSPLWWNAKYRQIQTLFERGMYEPADVAMRNLERSTAKDFADAPAILKPKFMSLRTEVQKMVHRDQPPVKTPEKK